MFLVFRRIWIRTVTVLIADGPISFMDYHLCLLILCNLTGDINSILLRRSYFRYLGITLTSYCPTILMRYNMLVFLCHLNSP